MVPDTVRVAAVTRVPVTALPMGAGLGAMVQTTQITDTRAVMTTAVPSLVDAVVDPVAVMAARLPAEAWVGNAARPQRELQFRGQRAQVLRKTRLTQRRCAWGIVSVMQLWVKVRSSASRGLGAHHCASRLRVG